MNENTRCSQAYMAYPSWSECWNARWWRACWDCWGLSVWREKCLPWHEWLIFWKKRRQKKTPNNSELWTGPDMGQKHKQNQLWAVENGQIYIYWRKLARDHPPRKRRLRFFYQNKCVRRTVSFRPEGLFTPSRIERGWEQNSLNPQQLLVV